MREIAVSKFKATCLSVIADVKRTRRPVRITRFGKPVADIVPPEPQRKSSWLGCMAGTAEIVGDIVSPDPDRKKWEQDLLHEWDEFSAGHTHLDLGGNDAPKARPRRSARNRKPKK